MWQEWLLMSLFAFISPEDRNRRGGRAAGGGASLRGCHSYLRFSLVFLNLNATRSLGSQRCLCRMSSYKASHVIVCIYSPIKEDLTSTFAYPF